MNEAAEHEEDEMLTLSLSDDGAGSAGGGAGLKPAGSASSNAPASPSFEDKMNAFVAASGGNHHTHENSGGGSGGDGEGNPLGLPLTLPTSPTLLPLSASPSSSAMDLSAMSKHHQALMQQQQAQQAQQQAQQSMQSVQSYFQADTDVTNGAVTSTTMSSAAGTTDFSDFQKSTEEYRRFTDDIAGKFDTDRGAQSDSNHPGGALGMPTATTTSPAPTKTHLKKRKSGANVSIDLQTKIRLIEVAEEYQYDPKCSGRGKQDGVGGAGNGKEQMSGIRLAAQFGLNKSTVSRILKRKEEFKKAYYKDNISGCSKHINKKSKFEKLNRLVENWFDMNREKKLAVSDTHIRDVGKRFAEELGIEDFRGSNGWVRSLRNRKEHQVRNLSQEAQELEKMRKEAEAIERIRHIFPNGVKDMAGFFKDLSIYLEKDGGGIMGFSGSSGGRDPASLGGASYTDMEDELSRQEDGGSMMEEFLKKKMVESLRLWSHELMESELAELKKRMKPRQAAML